MGSGLQKQFVVTLGQSALIVRKKLEQCTSLISAQTAVQEWMVSEDV